MVRNDFTFRDDDTDVNVAGEVITTGKYLIKYRVFKAGEFTLRVTIGIGLAQEDVGPCVGPCLGGRYAPHDVGTASPFNLLVIAAATDPGATLAWGAGVTSPIEAGISVMYEVQLRDKYENNKTLIEDAYLKDGPRFPTSKYPTPQIRYHTDCSETTQEISPFLCDLVVTRSLENVEFVELPLANAIVNGELQLNSLGIVATYLEEGRFTTSYSTTLAGAYDLSIALKQPDDATNTLVPSLASPYLLSVEPAEFDMRFAELLYFTPPDTGIPGFVRQAWHQLFSSLQELTHNIHVKGNATAAARPLVYLEGTAGFPSSFYIQRRDKYANLMRDPGAETFDVRIIGVNASTGEVYDLGHSAPGSTRPKLEYISNGLFKVEYYSNIAGNDFTLALSVGGQELSKLQPNAIGTDWEPIVGAEGKFKVRIRTSPTDPRWRGPVGRA